MPLLKKTFYPSQPTVPVDLSSKEEVYVVRVSGEVLRSYEEYLEKLKAYRTRQWTCKYSGKTGLTYEEALASELSHNKAFWEKFGNGWDDKVLRLVHHSTLGLEALVNHVYDSLRPALKSNGQENGEAEVKEKEKLPFTKNQLRTFIHERAEHRGDAAWFVPAEVVQKLGLPSQVPEAVMLAIKKASKKKQKAAGGGASSAEAGTAKLESKSASKAEAKSNGRLESKSATKVESKSASKAEGGRTPSKLTKLALAPSGNASAAVEVEAEGKENGNPMNGIQAPEQMEEAEKNLRPGTCKYAVFMVLKEVMPKGLSSDEIIARATERELKTDWSSKNSKNMLFHVLRDPVFVRVAKGRYTLAGAVGVVPYVPEERGEGQGDEPLDGGAPQAKSKDGKKRKKEREPREEEWGDELREGADVLKEQSKEEPKKKAKKEEAQGEDKGPVKARSKVEKKKTVEEQKENQGEEEGPVKARSKVEKKKTVDGQKENLGEEEGPVKAKSKSDKKKKKTEENGAAGSAADGAVTNEAADAEPEVMSLSALEQAAKKHAALVEDLRQRLEAADEKVKAITQKVLEAEETLAKWQAARRQQSDAEEMPSFELPEELREYNGDPDDRKALMAFKKKVEQTKLTLEQQKAEWLRESRAKKDKARQTMQKTIEAEKKELKKSQALMDSLKKEVAASVKAAAESDRVFERERAKVVLREAKEKEKQEREAAREREREERERRRLEALEAKRWPIEDLELLAEMQHRAQARGQPPPAEDLPLPCDWLQGSDAAAFADRMFVLDFLQQFNKTLKLPLTNTELDAMMTVQGDSQDLKREQITNLRKVYTRLMEVLLEDYEENNVWERTEKRWMAALSEATVMEVLRLYILSREDGVESKRSQMVTADIKEVAIEVAQGKEYDLAPRQHLSALKFLCDEVLDTELVRRSIQGRIEEAADVGAEMRAELAEERKKLRDIQEAQKEERKRKREEAQAAAIAAAQQAAAAAAENGVAEAVPAIKKSRSLAQLESTEFVEEPEPSWELPEEWREYTGDVDDRAAMIQFRQKQQEERRKLEKAKARWHDSQRRLRKEWENQQRIAKEEERRKQAELEMAEEAMLKIQDAYEKEMEKYIIRRAPIGLDRHHRRYWWAIAGLKDKLWVEEPSQRWGGLSATADVEALVNTLDNRGIRERELKAGFEKCQASILNAMKRAAQAREKVAKMTGTKRGREEEGKVKRTSSRLAEEAAKATKPLKEEETEEEGGPREEAAEEVGEHLDTLGSWALAAKLTAPKGGWKAWRARCQQIAAGELEEDDEQEKEKDETEGGDVKAEDTHESKPEDKHEKIVAALKERLLFIEEVLYDSTGERSKHDDTAEEGEGEEEGADSKDAEQHASNAGAMEVDEDDGDHDDRLQRVKRRLSHSQHIHVLNEEYVEDNGKLSEQACIWLSKRERTSWRKCTEAAAVIGSLAYWAAVVAHHAEAPMAKVAKSKGGASSKKRK